MVAKLIFTGVLLLVICVLNSQSQVPPSVVCVNVGFPDCQVFENKTAAPNTSSTIFADIVSLKTLYTTVNCSDFSYFFICAATYPYCISDTETLRYPCRDMCERVKRECSKVSTLLNSVHLFNCDVYAIGGRCITQDEALVSIRRAGLLPQQTDDDANSFAKGLIASWKIMFLVLTTLLTLL